jgi:hypothetical protein
VRRDYRHENFGKLWGILYCVSGLLNACIGVIAKQAAVEGTFFYINCALLGNFAENSKKHALELTRRGRVVKFEGKE